MKNQKSFSKAHKNLMRSVIALTLLLFISSESLAQRQTQGGSRRPTPTPRQGSGVNENNTGSSGQNIHDNAQSSSKMQQLGKQLGSVASGIFITKGISTTPIGWGYIALGIIAMYQAIDMGDKSNTSGVTADLTNSLGNPNFDGLTNPNGGGAGNTSPGITPGDLSTLRANLDKIKKAGGKVDLTKGTLTTANGKVYDLKKDFSSAAAMKKAGFSESAIKDMLKQSEQIAKQAEAQVAAHAVAIEEAGGEGGGAGAAGAIAGVSDDPSLYQGGAAGAGSFNPNEGIERDPAAISAGMSKDFNGEKIGVAYDSIFLMMNRRYSLKDSQGFFFKPSEGFGK